MEILFGDWIIVDGGVKGLVPQDLWGCDGRVTAYVDNTEAKLEERESEDVGALSLIHI